MELIPLLKSPGKRRADGSLSLKQLALRSEKLGSSTSSQLKPLYSQCWKSKEKVAFNNASEASYVYILSGQKFIRNVKMVHFGEFLKV